MNRSRRALKQAAGRTSHCDGADYTDGDVYAHLVHKKRRTLRQNPIEHLMMKIIQEMHMALFHLEKRAHAHVHTCVAATRLAPHTHARGSSP